jgi:predicted SprT family Zn-dependent metalloprotease
MAQQDSAMLQQLLEQVRQVRKDQTDLRKQLEKVETSIDSMRAIFLPHCRCGAVASRAILCDHPTVGQNVQYRCPSCELGDLFHDGRLVQRSEQAL